MSCQESECPRSRHMDTEAAVGHPASGCYHPLRHHSRCHIGTDGGKHNTQKHTETVACVQPGSYGTRTQALHSYPCTYDMLIVSTTLAHGDNEMGFVFPRSTHSAVERHVVLAKQLSCNVIKYLHLTSTSTCFCSFD